MNSTRWYVNGKTKHQQTKRGQTSKLSYQQNMHAKNKQKKLTARQFKANAMEEQVEATENLIAALMENHTCQIEMLIKSTTDAMKEMMQLVKNQTTMQSNPTNVLPFEEKKKKIQ